MHTNPTKGDPMFKPEGRVHELRAAMFELWYTTEGTMPEWATESDDALGRFEGWCAVQASLERKEVARRFLRMAVKKGWIVKPDRCEGCGTAHTPRKLHGHHEDHNKPLSVEWLCQACHFERDRGGFARRKAAA